VVDNMPEEFIIRGQTASGETETLNFSGQTPGYGFNLLEFQIFSSTGWPASDEMAATITAGKTAVTPTDPNFDDPGLIASTIMQLHTAYHPIGQLTIINDMFVITQDLILMVIDTAGATPVNWQCRFKKVKLSSSAEAVVNFKQFTIFDG